VYGAYVQGGAVIDKIMVIKDTHGAGQFDCHQQKGPRRPQHRGDFKPTLLHNSPVKPIRL